MKLHRAITEPIRTEADWHERWDSVDRGLIACWERGREKAEEDSALADCARLGELFVLPWKGGVDKEKPPKSKVKIGSLNYLAMWQGMRGEDLNIDTELGAVLTCSATGTAVTFTGDFAKVASA